MDTTHWQRVIAANVAGRRQKLGMTQAQLAGAVGTSVPAVSRLESGDHLPSLTTLLKVAEALDVPPGKLLTEPPAGQK